MKDTIWHSADYSQARIDGKAVVLVRGRDFYPIRWAREDLPWRIHATCTDMDDAQKIARLLNAHATEAATL